MITVLTRFAVSTAMDVSQVHIAFTLAAPAFRNLPDLIRKQFLLTADGHPAGGVCLWNNDDVARRFVQECVAPMIREIFQAEPSIEFYHSPVLVENDELQNFGANP